MGCLVGDVALPEVARGRQRPCRPATPPASTTSGLRLLPITLRTLDWLASESGGSRSWVHPQRDLDAGSDARPIPSRRGCRSSKGRRARPERCIVWPGRSRAGAASGRDCHHGRGGRPRSGFWRDRFRASGRAEASLRRRGRSGEIRCALRRPSRTDARSFAFFWPADRRGACLRRVRAVGALGGAGSGTRARAGQRTPGSSSSVPQMDRRSSTIRMPARTRAGERSRRGPTRVKRRRSPFPRGHGTAPSCASTATFASSATTARRVRRLAQLVRRTATEKPVSIGLIAGEADEAHRVRIERALELIVEGQIYQVNLARRFDFRLEGRAVDLVREVGRSLRALLTLPPSSSRASRSRAARRSCF